MPDAQGRIRGISVPDVPWHRNKPAGRCPEGCEDFSTCPHYGECIELPPLVRKPRERKRASKQEVPDVT